MRNQAIFINRISDTINGIEINVYELDESNQSMDAVNYLESYLMGKIKAMKMHQDFIVNDVFNVPILEKEYIDRINQEIQKVNNPAYSRLNWFDVRRSRVTEFMSQLLLEKEYQCTFFKEADKRINLSAYEADKHVSGIDVTGIQEQGEGFKFVLCEVKASKEKRIPCSSASGLLSDISSAYTNSKRVLREIESFYRKWDGDLEKSEVKNIRVFLNEILRNSTSQRVNLENILFIPFLIRSNPETIEAKSLEDFWELDLERIIEGDLKGILWAINFDINCLFNYKKFSN